MKSYNINTLGKKGRLWRLGTLIGLLSLALLITVGLLTACPEDSNGTNGTNGPSPLPPAFPLTVTDQAGRLVTIEAEPQKIISLAPSNTEIVYALGLEDRLVGVTTYCDYPEAALDKPEVGGFNTVDIEQVVAIQPDLILATDIHTAEVVPGLEGLGLTVLVLDPRSLDEILESITLAGKCTGKEDEASQLVADMENRIEAVTDKTANLTEAQRPSVFYIMWHEPLMTVGSDTRIYELIQLAGGIPVPLDLGEGYPMIGLEVLIAANPEVIIAGSGMGEGADLPYQFALTEPRLAGVDARINNRVYEVNTDLVGRPGPRIVDGLEQLARMIHPEIFSVIE